MIETSITLAPITTGPIVLCDNSFLTTLAAVEESVAKLKITDAETMQAAADIQSRLTRAGTQLDKAREILKKPFLDKGREIDAAARGPKARIDAAKHTVQGLLITYAAEQERIRGIAEMARQKELARLEAIRAAEERAAREKAAAEARAASEAAKASKAEVMELDFDEPEPAPAPPTETERAIAAIVAPPMPVAEKPAGIVFRCTLRIASADPMKIPEKYVIYTANMKAIRDDYCAKWKDGDPVPVCSGVVFEVDRTPVATGKGAF